LAVTASSRHPAALPAVFAIVVAAAIVVTFARAEDRLTWVLEAAPVLVGLPLVVATRRRFPLTPLLYVVLFVHALVLLHGAQYTYARTPLGSALQSMLGTARNPWDRVGHLLQGVTPALLAREILLRGRFVRRSPMLPFLCVSVALGVSLVYELIEWGVALAAGQSADAFLGTQGDPWDTQADMACALVGAVVALLVASSLQDRQIDALETRRENR
jgi:putative membrane protein